jgi:hypothetical protein
MTESFGYVFTATGQSLVAGAVEAAGRLLLGIPLHCLAAAMTGAMLCRKYIVREQLSTLRVLLPAVFIHGLFDLVQFLLLLFLNGSSGIEVVAAGAAAVVLVAGFLLARRIVKPVLLLLPEIDVEEGGSELLRFSS